MSDVTALLQRIFQEIINEGRLDVIDELFDDDFVDHGPMGEQGGREAFKAAVAAWRAAVPDVRCEIDNVIEQGDVAAWLVHTTGTHTGDGLGFPATGKAFRTVSANFGRFENCRAVEHWSEQGMLPMLVQLGVFQAPVPA